MSIANYAVNSMCACAIINLLLPRVLSFDFVIKMDQKPRYAKVLLIYLHILHIYNCVYINICDVHVNNNRYFTGY